MSHNRFNGFGSVWPTVELQCECARPVPHMPHELGFPVQDGPSSLPPPEEANTDSFLESRVEPQLGHLVPCHSLERTRISLSLSHFPQ